MHHGRCFAGTEAFDGLQSDAPVLGRLTHVDPQPVLHVREDERRACELAPMMQVDDGYEGVLTPEKVDRILAGLG